MLVAGAPAQTRTFTITIGDGTEILGRVHPSRQETPWFELGVHAVSDARVKVRPYLSAADAMLDDRIYYNLPIDGNIDSYASYDRAGNPRISINSGLIRAVDGLARAQVMGVEYDDHACFLNYLRYIGAQLENPIQSPWDFATKHIQLCPIEGFSLLIRRPSDRDQDRFQEYLELRSLSLDFVILHEFAHIKKHDSDIKSKQLVKKRREEMAADEFAGRYIIRMKKDPLLVIPILSLVAQLKQAQDGGANDHPTALKRIQAMVALSKTRMSRDRSKGSQNVSFVTENENEIATAYVADLILEARKK